jgi:hypothetical protein
MQNDPIGRRDFLKSTTIMTSAAFALPLAAHATASPDSVQDNMNIIGPREGYSPHIGTLVSMMTWMRTVMLEPAQGLTMAQLDYIHDKDSNSIGAMLLHLAATERFYQVNTFENKKWGDIDKKDADQFGVAMDLGEGARKAIKGKELKYYTDILGEVRARTLSEFKKRNDEWLLTVDNTWGWGPTNNYCKWFHVCEHESNHNGQIKWIKGRLHA